MSSLLNSDASKPLSDLARKNTEVNQGQFLATY
jgi:hypothetical protein